MGCRGWSIPIAAHTVSSGHAVCASASETVSTRATATFSPVTPNAAPKACAYNCIPSTAAATISAPIAAHVTSSATVEGALPGFAAFTATAAPRVKAAGGSNAYQELWRHGAVSAEFATAELTGGAPAVIAPERHGHISFAGTHGIRFHSVAGSRSGAGDGY